MITITSWNRNSKRFLRPPIFEWTCSSKAKSYRVEAAPRRSNAVIRFDTKAPQADFARIWSKLPVDEIFWSITARDGRGRNVDRTSIMRFCKAEARFTPVSKHADWRESAERNVEFLLTVKDPTKRFKPSQTLPSWFMDHAVDPRLPLYVWHSCLLDDEFLHEAAFPCLHYPILIRLFLTYSRKGRNAKLRQKAAEQAVLLGKMLRRFSWPASYKCHGLPCSSISRGKFGGHVEGSTYGITRAAWAGPVLFDLADATGQQSFRKHAWLIAEQLLKFQAKDGSFPMRVEPKTGKSTADYTTAGIAVAMFFDECQAREGANGTRWRYARDKAVAWMLANPVRTNRWEGLFEDVGVQEPFKNLSNLEALQTIRYFAAHAADDPRFLPAAEKINEWVEDQFVIFGRDDSLTERPPVPSVTEQFYCHYPMEVHTAHWMMALQALHRATGKRIYREKALAAADAITQFQEPDGRYFTFAPDVKLGRPTNRYDWFGCNALAAQALFALVADAPASRGPV